MENVAAFFTLFSVQFFTRFSRFQSFLPLIAPIFNHGGLLLAIREEICECFTYVLLLLAALTF